MPKEPFRIDKFAGMKPSSSDGGSLALVRNARIDMVPNLVQENADLLVADTIHYIDKKKISVNGTDHIVAITTDNKVIVDGVEYDSVTGGGWEITSFGNCAILINTLSNAYLPKIVTFGTNLEKGIFDTTSTLVSDDSVVTIGGLSDITKMIALNKKMVLVLFKGDTKLNFLILDGFTAADTEVYTTGQIIPTAGIDQKILYFEAHYDGATIDYIVYLYYNDSGVLCFGKFGITDWFNASDTSVETDFILVEDEADLGTLTCSGVTPPSGYRVVGMAVTRHNVYFQYGSDGTIGHGNITEAQDVLYSIPLSNFSAGAATSVTAKETGWVTTDIQKSKLPVSNDYAIDPVWHTKTILRLHHGIVLLSYLDDIVGICASISVVVDSDNIPTGVDPYNQTTTGLMVWNGIQPFDSTDGIGNKYTITIEGVKFTKAFDTTANHSGGACVRNFLDSDIGYSINPINLFYAYGVMDNSDITSTPFPVCFAHSQNSAISGLLDFYDIDINEKMSAGMDVWCTLNGFDFIPNLRRGTEATRLVGATELHLSNTVFAIPPQTFADTYGNSFAYSDREVSIVEGAFERFSSVKYRYSINELLVYGVISTNNNLLSILETEVTGTSIIREITRYGYSFLYDGYQESPLSLDRYDTTNATDDFTVDVTITLTDVLMAILTKRVTAVNIYAAKLVDTEEEELYRLVRSLPITYDNFSYNSVENNYTSVFRDDLTRYASFNATAGFSETLELVSVKRSVQCSCSGYMFIGNVSIYSSKDKTPVDNLIVRSLPLQPSVYDYSTNFAVLPFTATVMAEYNGRLYVFGKDQYAVINPETLAVELKSDSIGCLSSKHIVSTEYGIFIYFKNNIYAVDGANVIPLGNDIAISVYGTTVDVKTLDSIVSDVFMFYYNERSALVFLGNTSTLCVMYMYSIPNKRWMSYSTGHTDSLAMLNEAYQYDGKIYINHDLGAGT